MARTKNEKKKDQPQPKGTNTVLVIHDITHKTVTEIKGGSNG